MVLYSHQADSVDDALAAVTFGAKEVVLEAPTSFGKSLVIAELAKQLEGSVVILVNITELIDQIAEHLDALDTTYSIVKAQRDSEYNLKERIQIVMSQTYYARLDKLKLEADFVLQDEIHKEFYTSRTKAVMGKLKPKARIGFSGTPFDSLGYALPNVDEVISTITIKELEEKNYLSPVKYFVPKWAEEIDYSSVKNSTSDYNTTQLEAITNKTSHLALAIESMNRMHAKDHKGIVFCSSIEQADHFAGLLKKDGYHAEPYHSETDHIDEIMTAYKTNKPRKLPNKLAEKGSLFENQEEFIYGEPVKWLVAVDKISIGFSVKDITFGVSLRPTKVLSLYRQMVGRTIRCYKPLDAILSKY